MFHPNLVSNPLWRREKIIEPLIERVKQADAKSMGFRLSEEERMALRAEQIERRRARKERSRARWESRSWGGFFVLACASILVPVSMPVTVTILSLMATGLFCLNMMAYRQVHSKLYDWFGNDAIPTDSTLIIYRFPWFEGPMRVNTIKKVKPRGLYNNIWASEKVLRKQGDYGATLPIIEEHLRHEQLKKCHNERLQLIAEDDETFSKNIKLAFGDNSLLSSQLEKVDSAESLTESEVEHLRKALNAYLTPKNDKIISQGVSLSSVAFDGLIVLAKKRPLNQECPIDLELIPERDRIYLSTGDQYNIHNLLQHFNLKRKFINPLTADALFSKYDIAHIQKVLADKKLKVTFSTGPVVRVSSQASRLAHNPHVLLHERGPARSSGRPNMTPHFRPMPPATRYEQLRSQRPIVVREESRLWSWF
jgi:hypothetical protein